MIMVYGCGELIGEFETIITAVAVANGSFICLNIYFGNTYCLQSLLNSFALGHAIFRFYLVS